jgi:hypothetical protein
MFSVSLLCLMLASPSAFSKEKPVKQNPHTEVIYTDQGSDWTEETRADYYSIDQGSRMIPYNWLLALTQPDGSPFASNQGGAGKLKPSLCRTFVGSVCGAWWT